MATILGLRAACQIAPTGVGSAFGRAIQRRLIRLQPPSANRPSLPRQPAHTPPGAGRRPIAEPRFHALRTKSTAETPADGSRGVRLGKSEKSPADASSGPLAAEECVSNETGEAISRHRQGAHHPKANRIPPSNLTGSSLGHADAAANPAGRSAGDSASAKQAHGSHFRPPGLHAIPEAPGRRGPGPGHLPESTDGHVHRHGHGRGRAQGYDNGPTHGQGRSHGNGHYTSWFGRLRLALLTNAKASVRLGKRVIDWYMHNLHTYPVLTKSVTSGFMYCFGDLLAQLVAPADTAEKMDAERAAIFFIYGLVVAGPIYHLWFSRLDQLPFLMMKTRRFRQMVRFRRLQRSAKELGVTLPAGAKPAKPAEFSRVTKVASKVLADQLVFSPAYLVLFFYTTGLMRGQSLEDCSSHIREVFWPSYLADCAVWPLVQVINFAFVPVPLQPIYVNVLNVFWNAFLSFMAHKSH